MKNILILLQFIIQITFSQTKENLKTEFTDFYQSTTSKNIDKLMNFTYPKIFAIATSEQIKEAFEESFENDILTANYKEINPNLQVQEIIKFKDHFFCKLSYQVVLEMNFKNENQDYSESTMAMFKERTGADNITFDKTKNSITLDIPIKSLAIYDETTNKSWKFLVLEKDSQILKMLFNEDILEKLGLN